MPAISSNHTPAVDALIRYRDEETTGPGGDPNRNPDVARLLLSASGSSLHIKDSKCMSPTMQVLYSNVPRNTWM